MIEQIFRIYHKLFCYFKLNYKTCATGRSQTKFQTRNSPPSRTSELQVEDNGRTVVRGYIY